MLFTILFPGMEGLNKSQIGCRVECLGKQVGYQWLSFTSGVEDLGVSYVLCDFLYGNLLSFLHLSFELACRLYRSSLLVRSGGVRTLLLWFYFSWLLMHLWNTAGSLTKMSKPWEMAFSSKRESKAFSRPHLLLFLLLFLLNLAVSCQPVPYYNHSIVASREPSRCSAWTCYCRSWGARSS